MKKLCGKIYKNDSVYTAVIYTSKNKLVSGMTFEDAETAEKYCESWCGWAWGWE